MGALGALLERFWAFLGRSKGALGAILGPFGPLLGQPSSILGAFGCSWGALGAFLGRSLGILVGFGLDLGWMFGRFLVDLDAIWDWLFHLSLLFFSLLSCFELRQGGEFRGFS